MNGLQERLVEKGWPTSDIRDTLRIIDNAQQKKTAGIRFLDKSVYWVVLLVAIIGNLIISIVLIPFFLVLKEYLLYLIIITLGITFGLFFNLLINNIEGLSKTHHVIVGLFIPVFALVNMFYITGTANYLQTLIQIDNIQQPWLIGVVYALAFISPYLVPKLYQINL